MSMTVSYGRLSWLRVNYVTLKWYQDLQCARLHNMFEDDVSYSMLATRCSRLDNRTWALLQQIETQKRHRRDRRLSMLWWAQQTMKF